MSAKAWTKFVVTSFFIGALLLASRAASAAQGDSYRTLEAAAIAALADAEALTLDYEAGGTIYQCGPAYAYMAPVTQRLKVGVAVPVYDLESCALVGMYHTHPKGDAMFSRDDIRGICARHTVGFIKPHGSAVRMFDCRDLSPGGIQIALRGEARVITLEG